MAISKDMSKYEAQITNDMHRLFWLYAMMLHIRVIEEAATLLYAQGEIAGFCHVYIGQEAVGVGIQSILKRGDNTISSYRVHGHGVMCRMLDEYWQKYNDQATDANNLFDSTQKLFDSIQKFINDKSQANAILAELMGRQNGCSKGKGGSMHMFDTEYNFYGGHGIVGIQVPLGTGLAFADKYNNKQNVTFVSLGDGAMNQGQVYEAFNMAGLWKLPVIFVIENNGYAIGTAVNRSCAGGPLYERAKPFGIDAHLIDGMNVVEVAAAANYARQYALDHGPVLLECDTYRYKPHSMSDPGTYRTKEEVQRMIEERDPIDYVKNLLMSKYEIKADVFAMYEEAEKIRAAQVVEYAKESPFPGEEELYSDIYRKN